MHICVFSFGSWTYGTDELDIVSGGFSLPDVESEDLQPAGALVLQRYTDECPSVVLSHESKRTFRHYDCCPEPYVHIVINLKLAWR